MHKLGTDNQVNLIRLSQNHPATIVALTDNPAFGEVDAMVTRRLQDLGFLSGVAIEVIAKSFTGSPIAVRLDGRVQFSLRREEASKILCHLD